MDYMDFGPRSTYSRLTPGMYVHFSLVASSLEGVPYTSILVNLIFEKFIVSWCATVRCLICDLRSGLQEQGD